MTATKQDFTIYRGESKTLQVTVMDAASAAFDLTGASAVEWRIGPLAGGTAVLTKTLSSGVTIVGAISGRFDVAVSAADSAAIAASHYLHQAVVTDASGDTETVTVGTVTVKEKLS